MRSSARPPSKSREKISAKWRLISVEGLLEALLRRAGHAAERLLEILHRRDHVVVLGAQEVESLLELAVLLVGHQVHGAHGLELGGELLVPLRGPRPGLAPGSCAPSRASALSTAWRRRASWSSSSRRTRPSVSLRSSSWSRLTSAFSSRCASRELALDRLPLGDLPRCSSATTRDLGLAAIALRRRLARQGVGPLPLARRAPPGARRVWARRPHRLARAGAPNSRSSSPSRSMSRPRASTRSATVASSTRQAVTSADQDASSASRSASSAALQRGHARRSRRASRSAAAASARSSSTQLRGRLVALARRSARSRPRASRDGAATRSSSRCADSRSFSPAAAPSPGPGS